MSSKNSNNSSIVISYLQLRTAVGIIGIALPFVLALAKLVLDGPGIQPSISAYYHTGARDIFVGGLCAIGVFLGSYRGYDRKDINAGNITCVAAIGVALFPVAPEAGFTDFQLFIGRFHLAFAAVLFLTLAYFCIKLFTRTHGDDKETPAVGMTPMKKKRNKVYLVCGYLIVACIALIVVCNVLFLNRWSFFPDSTVRNLDPVFWLEAIAVVSFGISWLTKGEAILGDTESGASS